MALFENLKIKHNNVALIFTFGKNWHSKWVKICPRKLLDNAKNDPQTIASSYGDGDGDGDVLIFEFLLLFIQHNAPDIAPIVPKNTALYVNDNALFAIEKLPFWNMYDGIFVFNVDEMDDGLGFNDNNTAVSHVNAVVRCNPKSCKDRLISILFDFVTLIDDAVIATASTNNSVPNLTDNGNFFGGGIFI